MLCSSLGFSRLLGSGLRSSLRSGLLRRLRRRRLLRGLLRRRFCRSLLSGSLCRRLRRSLCRRLLRCCLCRSLLRRGLLRRSFSSGLLRCRLLSGGFSERLIHCGFSRRLICYRRVCACYANTDPRVTTERIKADRRDYAPGIATPTISAAIAIQAHTPRNRPERPQVEIREFARPVLVSHTGLSYVTLFSRNPKRDHRRPVAGRPEPPMCVAPACLSRAANSSKFS